MNVMYARKRAQFENGMLCTGGNQITPTFTFLEEENISYLSETKIFAPPQTPSQERGTAKI